MVLVSLLVSLLPQLPPASPALVRPVPSASAPTSVAPTSVVPPPRDLAAILAAEPACRAVLAQAAAHRLQVLLAEPIERADGSLGLRRSSLGDPSQYFYPASAIKLCGAIAALLHLNAHNQSAGTSLGLDSAWAIEKRFAGDVRIDADPSNVQDGRLTVRHALRKLLLVSDNAAYNHCFDLCGQDGLNAAMWRGGFASVCLWHRLSEARKPDEHGVTRAVRIDGTLFPARDAHAALDNRGWRELDVGTAHVDGGEPKPVPLSFAQKNAIALQDLQDVLVEVVRPEIDTGKRGFPELTTAQRQFLVTTMGEYPRESTNPKYDSAAHPDHDCKFVLRGVRSVVPQEHLRVFDKIGRAYGFSIENAWIEDTRTGAGFFLAIVLYTNQDGVLNDDRYEYETVADPFLDAVGAAVARAVWPSAGPAGRR
ncbi:MAG: serine hydrolase [Planctomycetota bacterium]